MCNATDLAAQPRRFVVRPSDAARNLFSLRCGDSEADDALFRFQLAAGLAVAATFQSGRRLDPTST